MRFITLLATLSFAASAAAHGYLATLTIDGKAYKGNGDGGDPSSTVIRPTKPYDVGPVTDVTSTDLRCGLSPVSNAALQADAQPGSTIDVLWVSLTGHWIHNVGPIMHYMAECTGTPDCTTFDAANAKWFKIDEKGFKADGTTWYMDDFYNSKPVSLTIPSNLKAGNYLLRSELISLQRAASQDGAEFYPNCAQLSVGGSGTGTPASTVSFPGAYSATDKGVLVDVYTDLTSYDFPGPAVAKLSGSGSSSSASSGSGSSSGSGASSAASTKTAKASSAKPSTKAASSSVVAATTDSEPEPVSTASAPKASSSGMCKNKNSRRRRSEASRRRVNHARSQALRGHHVST